LAAIMRDQTRSVTACALGEQRLLVDGQDLASRMTNPRRP
jgi:hypothetical protein